MSHITYDTTSVGSAAVRDSIVVALSRLSLHEDRGLTARLQDRLDRFPEGPSVIVHDLSRLEDDRVLDYWSASPWNVSFVFLVRTANDRRRLGDPEIAMRLGDERFFLCDMSSLSSGSARRREAFLTSYFRALIDRIAPDRVRSAKFSPMDRTLWLEFGDGLERCVAWADLAFAKRLDFEPVSASAASGGQAVMLLGADGRAIDVDAGALRAAVDPDRREGTLASDNAQRSAVGRRLRALRDERGLSQDVLAARSGIPQESLSRLENGKRDPRLDTLRKLAAGLGMDLAGVLAHLNED